MEPPSKRPRTGPASYDGDDSDSEGVAEDELSMNPLQFDIEQDPLYELDKGRADAATRLKSRFESIFAKYERDFTGIGDEIDFHTGEVVVDNGHIEAILQDGNDYEDDNSGSASDGDASDDEADVFVPGNILSEPDTAALDTSKDHWALPDDLPNLDGQSIPMLPVTGAARSDASASVYQGASLPTAPPLLNPALLHYDSFGQARMRRSLSDMLSRYSHSRLTNAKSFVQAQRSTTNLTAGNRATIASSSRAFGARRTAGASAYLARHVEANDQPHRKSSQHSLAEKASANLEKKVKELRKIRNSAKSKKLQGAKSATRSETTIDLEQDDGSVVKRKRGRPRKIRPSEEGEAALRSSATQTPGSSSTITPTPAGQRQSSSKPGRHRPDKSADDRADVAAVLKSQPVKRAYRKSLASRRRKPVGSDKRLVPKPSVKRKQLRTETGSQRKSARERKQTEFYGELISTLEIEQSLLESDYDDDDDASGILRSIHGLAMAHLLDGGDATQGADVHEDENENEGDDEGEDGDDDATEEGERGNFQKGRTLSPKFSSQRTVRDSQESTSSLPLSKGSPTPSQPKRLPFRAARQVVRDSQDPSSSIPIPDFFSQPSSQPPSEVFKRNEVDPSYGFSDDDGEVDHGIRPPSHTLKGQSDDTTQQVAIVTEVALAHPSEKSLTKADAAVEITQNNGASRFITTGTSDYPKDVLLHSTQDTLANTNIQDDAIVQVHSHDVMPMKASFQEDILMAEFSSPVLSKDLVQMPPPIFCTSFLQLIPESPPTKSVDHEVDHEGTPIKGNSSPVALSDEPAAPPTLPSRIGHSESVVLSTESPEPVGCPDLGIVTTPTHHHEPLSLSPPALDLPASAHSMDYIPEPSSAENTVIPPARIIDLNPTARSSSLTATGPEDEPHTPQAHRSHDIKVKTVSTFRRRVLALSNLVPDPLAVDGDEDELSTNIMPTYRPKLDYPDRVSQSVPANRRRLSAPPSRPSAQDKHGRDTKSRRQIRQTDEAVEDSRGNELGAASSRSTSDVETVCEVAAPRQRKTGFGFENARGAVPRAPSVTPRLVPPLKAPSVASGTNTKSNFVTRNRPDLQPAIGSSPPKTAQISPLARRTLVNDNAAPRPVAETPKNRKRRRQTDSFADGGDEDSSSAGELVQTPGGTLRRCGVGGFTCDRDFCMVCCI